VKDLPLALLPLFSQLKLTQLHVRVGVGVLKKVYKYVNYMYISSSEKVFVMHAVLKSKDVCLATEHATSFREGVNSNFSAAY